VSIIETRVQEYAKAVYAAAESVASEEGYCSEFQRVVAKVSDILEDDGLPRLLSAVPRWEVEGTLTETYTLSLVECGVEVEVEVTRYRRWSVESAEGEDEDAAKQAAIDEFDDDEEACFVGDWEYEVDCGEITDQSELEQAIDVISYDARDNEIVEWTRL
jgi:hypothetical protein